jgi:hypothetical protein
VPLDTCLLMGDPGSGGKRADPLVTEAWRLNGWNQSTSGYETLLFHSEASTLKSRALLQLPTAT